jgi:carotenoid cleavage dioxygenase-like enzyme
MVRAMHDLVIAVAFLILVASPAVVAAVPISAGKRQDQSANRARNAGDLPANR